MTAVVADDAAAGSRRRRSRRSLIAVAVGVVVCVVGGLLAWRTVHDERPDALEASARRDALAQADARLRELTGAAARARDLPDAEFEAAMLTLVDRGREDEVSGSGDGRVAWRTHVVGQEVEVLAGWLSNAEYVVICLEVTADRHASPLVRMEDSACPTGVKEVGADADLVPSG